MSTMTPTIRPDDSPRVRGTDDISSHEAADGSNVTGSRLEVMSILGATPDTMLADHEIYAEHVHLTYQFNIRPYTPQRLRTARAELVEAGLVRASGIYRLTPTGYRAQVWQVEMEWLESRGFTVTVIERAKPSLPTEPGIYAEVGKHQNLVNFWHLTENGKWLSGAGGRYDNRAEKYGPFVKVEPVAETAKRIVPDLEEVARCIGRSSFIGTPVSTVDVGKARKLVAKLLTELGVSES